MLPTPQKPARRYDPISLTEWLDQILKTVGRSFHQEFVNFISLLFDDEECCDLDGSCIRGEADLEEESRRLRKCNRRFLFGIPSMFHILAWRWPFLALFLAAVFYIGRYYTLAGIEHLHLERRDVPAEVAVSNHDGRSTDPSLWTWDPVQANLPDGFLANPFRSRDERRDSASSGNWSDRLTIGEKLAVLESQDIANSTQVNEKDAREIDASILPISPPIPVPERFIPKVGLRSSRGSDATVAPDRFRVQPDGSKQAGSVESKQDIAPGPASSATSPVPAGAMTSLTPVFRAGDNLVGKSQEQVRSPAREEHVIRIGSFHTGTLSPAKLAKPHAMAALIRLIRMYDVVALQGIQCERDDILPVLVDKLQQSGRSFDYLIGPRVGRVSPKVQLAFLFDKDRLETDRYQLYTLDDPQDLLQYEPLVGWFRCKGVPTQDAFTFSLINLVLDRSLAESERRILPDIVSAIQADGRNEDDWILAGQIFGSVETLPFPQSNAVRFAIRNVPTDVTGTTELDTICFSSLATTEYTGRSGVYDFLRKYNLSLESAMEISSHMPVWAEFRIVEGSVPGRVAPLLSNP